MKINTMDRTVYIMKKKPSISSALKHIGGGTCRLEKLEPHLNLAPVGSASPELRL
jgi:hypothetical protein